MTRRLTERPRPRSRTQRGGRRSHLAGLTIVVAVVALLAASCTSSKSAASGGKPPTSHVLHLSFLADPGQPPDPDVFYAGEGLLLTRNMYEGLVQYQPGTATRRIVPSLATSWTVSADGLTYTFNLRHGVTFHDGTPFTSAAVGASFARRTAVHGGPAYMVAGVASVATPGPYKAVVTLKKANSAFLDYLAAPYGPVMESPTALKLNAGKDDDKTWLQTHDIGTGAYTLTQAKVGVSYQMKAYPRYWGAKPYYTTIDLPVIDDLSTQEIQFDDGQVDGILHDLTTTAAKQYQHNKADAFYELPTLQDVEAFVNPHKGIFTNNATRVALLKAINLPAIVAGVFPGHGATVPTQTAPSNMMPLQYAKQSVSYDPSALKSVVDKLPSSEKSITIGWDIGAPIDELIAEQIGAELLSTGLTAKVVGVQTSSIYSWVGSVNSAKTVGTNILIDGFWPDADTPYTWSHILFDSSGGTQFFSCDNQRLDALDTQAVQTGSDKLYSQVSDLAMASGCWLVVADKTDQMVFKPWLKGVAAAHVVGSPQSLQLAKLYPAS